MSTNNQRRVWVTGATSGIGEGLVKALAEQGDLVIASGRRQEVLDNIKALNPNNIRTIAFDVTDLEATIAAAKQIDTELGGLDTIVINAGTCEYVDVKNFSSAMCKRVIDTNYIGLTNCVEAALPLLRKGNDPYLVGMSSTVAYGGLSRAEAYGASKAAVSHFLEALRIDLTAEKIDVSVICPGFVKTPLTDLNDFPMPMRITTEEAAEYIIKGMKKRNYEIHFPKMFSYSMKLFASLPGRLRNKLAQGMINESS